MLAAGIIALVVVSSILGLLLLCIKSPDFVYPSIEEIKETAGVTSFTIDNDDFDTNDIETDTTM